MVRPPTTPRYSFASLEVHLHGLRHQAPYLRELQLAGFVLRYPRTKDASSASAARAASTTGSEPRQQLHHRECTSSCEAADGQRPDRRSGADMLKRCYQLPQLAGDDNVS
ncbi:hypothetical protein A0H81_07386 [Grifola frondosa]|uniref:Uncharacterized protein n=1 Tax=Grifola frondosa TaxID=5627 RepID=A0A1C7M7H0_GRIFR|nr:hypothetical protein A0H81_07386 [Grifola frondosa]